MTILVFSDSHGSTYSIDTILEQEARVDSIIFCGDIARDADYIREYYPMIPLYAVRGNNDFYCDDPYLLMPELDGVRIYITHGHRERVKFGLHELAAHCRKNNCVLGLFGHTHSPFNAEVGGVQLVNPGSIRSSHGTYSRIKINHGSFTVENLSL